MLRRCSARVTSSVLLFAATLTGLGPAVFAQAPRAVDESFFAEKVYPVLHAVQCERCHSDNGVASETRLEFPEPDAGHDRITAFGLSLMDLVDRQEPGAIVVVAEADEANEALRRPANQAGQRRRSRVAELDQLPGRPLRRAGPPGTRADRPVRSARAWRRWPCVA